ncbi:methyltransferase family protein [Loktanella salsilacus]|uniref:methyltransferase family protein n=1 Tax=Loktanella salsilacus TaxID=195913 RepID=UPI00373681D5
MNLVDFAAGCLALAYFLMIAAATKQHFNSDKYPWGMHLISVLSLIGVSFFMYTAFLLTLSQPVVVIALIVAAFALFVWATRHSNQKQLGLAFAEDFKTNGIITTGPWQYVRHPFYVSYIIFWMACAIGTVHVVSIIVFAALLFIYVYSALREEAWLRGGDHGSTYVTYQRSTGFFLPTRVMRKTS